MAQAFLLFDFGNDEETLQSARHRLDAWKQAFRLGNKLSFKFERPPSTSTKTDGPDSRGKREERKEKAAKDADRKEGQVRLLVRLDFSPHEKNLYQTWVERVPREEPFKSANPQTIDRLADHDKFDEISALFRDLG